jgi:hypothetical protein
LSIKESAGTPLAVFAFVRIFAYKKAPACTGAFLERIAKL